MKEHKEKAKKIIDNLTNLVKEYVEIENKKIEKVKKEKQLKKKQNKN